MPRWLPRFPRSQTHKQIRKRHQARVGRLSQLDGLKSGLEYLEDRTLLAADLAMEMNVTPTGSVVPGELLTYTIHAQNLAAATTAATGVAVSDTLPAGETFVDVTVSGSGAPTVEGPGSTVTTNLGTLVPGADNTIVIQALVNTMASGTLTNSAGMTNTSGDTNPANATAINTVSTTAPTNNVSVTTASLPSNYTGTAGALLFYSVTVTNNTATAASGVVVVDRLDPNETFVSASDTNGDTFTNVGRTITGTITNLAGSGTDTVRINVIPTTSAAVVGSVTNTAFVAVPGGNLSANNVATSMNPVSPAPATAPDVSVTKDSVPSNATGTIGTPLTYQLTLTNNSTNSASGPSSVNFFDRLDPNETFVSATDNNGNSFSAVGSTLDGSLVLAGNATDTITVVVIPTTAAGAAGSVTNTVAIAIFGGNQSTNIMATKTNTVAPAGGPLANVSVSKSAPPSGTVGTPVTDTITLANNGSAAVTNAALVDMLGPNVSNVSASDAAGDTFTFASGQLSGTIANLPVGATQVSVVYTPTATGTFSDTALVSVPGGNQGTAFASASTTVVTPAVLAITKSGGPSTINVGGTVQYVIIVTKSGQADATGAVVTDVLPAGLTVVSAFPNPPGVNSPSNPAGDSVAINANTVTDRLGTLGQNGEAFLTITATAAQLPNGTTNLTVTNTASVAYAGTTTKSDAVNTTISTTTPLLSISKGANDQVHVGGTVIFTITVANSGGAAATGAVITDPLQDAGILTNLQATDPAGTVTISNNSSTGGHIVTDNLGAVPAYGTETLTITGTALPIQGGDAGGIENTADLTFSGTTTASNSVTTHISAVPAPTGVGFLAGMPGNGTPHTLVQNLYHELLGREPDEAGDSFWVSYLSEHNNANGVSQAISAFLNSPEYAIHYITSLYQIILGRAPDAAGLQYWTAKMGSPGTPGGATGSADEKAIVAALFGSDEFYIQSGNTAQGWIDALYEGIFGRAADGGGQAYWTNELAVRGAGDRDGIVRDLLSTPEAAHLMLDSFYPAVGGTTTNPLPVPGAPAGAGSTELATITGGGWENLYLQGPYDSQPQGNDIFFNALASGATWDDVQLLLLETGQFFTNPNRPVTA